MNAEQKKHAREQLAELDEINLKYTPPHGICSCGYLPSGGMDTSSKCPRHGKYTVKPELPHYLDPREGHGHLQRIWSKLSRVDKRIVIAHLTGSGGILEQGGSDRFLLDLTPEEWAEAILRAVGKWGEQPKDCEHDFDGLDDGTCSKCGAVGGLMKEEKQP